MSHGAHRSLFEEVVQGYKGENTDIEFEERCDAKTYHNRFSSMKLFIRMFDMTLSYVWRDSFVCVT